MRPVDFDPPRYRALIEAAQSMATTIATSAARTNRAAKAAHQCFELVSGPGHIGRLGHYLSFQSGIQGLQQFGKQLAGTIQSWQ